MLRTKLKFELNFTWVFYGLEADEYSQTQIEEAARRANAWEFIESFTHGTQQNNTFILIADSSI